MIYCLIKAVISKRTQAIDWNDLKYKDRWFLGWKLK
ncbi:TIGR02450 family Trp-rich protein [Photobacterium frigidiphilum]